MEKEKCIKVKLWAPMPGHPAYNAWKQNKQQFYYISADNLKKISVNDQVSEKIANEYDVDINPIKPNGECIKVFRIYVDNVEEEVILQGPIKNVVGALSDFIKLIEDSSVTPWPYDETKINAIEEALGIDSEDPRLKYTDDYRFFYIASSNYDVVVREANEFFN